MKNEAFTTSAERTALPAAGAPAWAGGNHMWSGNSAVLARRPTVISAAAPNVTLSGADPLRQQYDIERAVGAVEKDDADRGKGPSR